MLQADRRAGSGQAGDTPGQTGSISGWDGRRQTDRSQDWGPAAQDWGAAETGERPRQENMFAEGLGASFGWAGNRMEEQGPLWL